MKIFFDMTESNIKYEVTFFNLNLYRFLVQIIVMDFSFDCLYYVLRAYVY